MLRASLPGLFGQFSRLAMNEFRAAIFKIFSSVEVGSGSFGFAGAPLGSHLAQVKDGSVNRWEASMEEAESRAGFRVIATEQSGGPHERSNSDRRILV
jgi:hypothetical protein